MSQSFEEKAADVAVLGRVDVIMGIPMNYFMLALAIAMPLATMVWWLYGVITATLLLSGLYQLHAQDPQALDIWIDRVRSQIRVWRAGAKTPRTIILL